MASKGQKFKKYTEEFKQMILNEYYGGITGATELSSIGLIKLTIHKDF